MPSPCLPEASPDCCLLYRVPFHVTWLSGWKPLGSRGPKEPIGSFWTRKGRNSATTKQLSYLEVLRSSEECGPHPELIHSHCEIRRLSFTPLRLSGSLPCTTTFSERAADAGCFYLFLHSLLKHISHSEVMIITHRLYCLPLSRLKILPRKGQRLVHFGISGHEKG